MSNVFRPDARAADSLISFIEDLGKPSSGGSPGPAGGSAQQPMNYSGSGLAISEGAILTNAHVVESCKTIEVAGYGNARLLAFDPDYDLAVLRLSGRKPASVGQIQVQPPELGQEVVILGYPLSDLMGNELSVTTGLISRLSGLGGEPGSYTLTANVQPGNSGGPVLDRNGNVIGVAVAKLDEAKLLQETGTTGANIGFAISGKRLLEFLAPFKTSTTAYKPDEELSVQAITARAQHFTVQVLCRN
jgi:S1-C subfamily serine protease